MGFLAELKRRNVVRMAGLYLLGAWLAVQVSETLLPLFGTPEWVLRALVLLLVLGLAPALVFSWLYELTPDGLKRDAEVPADASIAVATGRRMDRLMLGRTDDAVALLQPFERAGNTYALAGYLTYPEFDPSPFPSLVRMLAREKVQRPPALALPFACPPAKQGAG